MHIPQGYEIRQEEAGGFRPWLLVANVNHAGRETGFFHYRPMSCGAFASRSAALAAIRLHRRTAATDPDDQGVEAEPGEVSELARMYLSGGPRAVRAACLKASRKHEKDAGWSGGA